MDTHLLAMTLQSLLGLSAVLGLFALLVWGIRRFQHQQRGNQTRDFKIIQRMHLDTKNSIVEIRHQGRHYLLGLSPNGMVQLHSDHALPATTPSPQADHHA